MGLSLSQDIIVQVYGGMLIIDSQEGERMTCSVGLPVNYPASRTLGKPPPVPVSGSPPHTSPRWPGQRVPSPFERRYGC